MGVCGYYTPLPVILQAKLETKIRYDDQENIPRAPQAYTWLPKAMSRDSSVEHTDVTSVHMYSRRSRKAKRSNTTEANLDRMDE